MHSGDPQSEKAREERSPDREEGMDSGEEKPTGALLVSGIVMLVTVIFWGGMYLLHLARV